VVLALAALAAQGCGGDDDAGQTDGELTREQVVAALRETQPNCESPRSEDFKGEGGVEIFQISCDEGGVLWQRLTDAEGARRLADSGTATDYLAGRAVITLQVIDNPEGFRTALAKKCSCEIEVVRPDGG
jgi:hypothetical protein